MSKKILIISPSWIGDCVMTQPLCRRLHQFHPGCRIDVFAPKWSMAVFERMPEISRILENPFAHGALQLRRRWQLGKELGRQGYDQVIVLPGSFKSALIARASGIRRRTGYVGESRYPLLNDIRKLDKAALPLMVDRYTALAYPKGVAFEQQPDFPSLSVSPAGRQAALLAHELTPCRSVVAFCPGAEYGSAKRWPPHHFAVLAKHYVAEGYQIWLFGSAKDYQVAEEVQRLSGSLCINLCGRTSLSEAIDLLSLSQLVVCNDSGLMHLAAALGRPLVSIYGSSSPEHTPPLSRHVQIVSLYLDCSPCFQRECPLGHTDCLNQLEPDWVYQAGCRAVQSRFPEGTE